MPRCIISSPNIHTRTEPPKTSTSQLSSPTTKVDESRRPSMMPPPVPAIMRPIGISDSLPVANRSQESGDDHREHTYVELFGSLASIGAIPRSISASSPPRMLQSRATQRAALKVADISRSTSLPASRTARLRKSSPFITNPIHATLISDDTPTATPVSKGESGGEAEAKSPTQSSAANATEQRTQERSRQLAELHPARYLRRSASSDGDHWAEFLSRIMHKHPELKDIPPTVSGEYFDD